MKRAVFTTTTTLPASIPRGTVLETLQNHREMINLNPLVTNYALCQPVPSAPAEERDLDWTWYEITDRISFLPGGLMRGNISYKGSFHDIPRGIRTHVYAPTGLDIRATWSVGGSEPREGREDGGSDAEPSKLNATASFDEESGLYLREEIDLRCPFWSVGFVKKNLKRSHGVLVDRLVGKAGQNPNQDQKQTHHQAQGQNETETQSQLPRPIPPPEIRINDVQVPAWRLSEQIRAAPNNRRKQSFNRVEQQ